MRPMPSMRLLVCSCERAELRLQRPDEGVHPGAHLAVGDLEDVDHVQRDGVEEERAQRLAAKHEQARCGS